MVGTKIREFRKQKGITQQQLAEKIGVQHAVISKYENGKIEPSLTQIKAIAKALDVNTVDLIDDMVNEIRDFLLNVQGFSPETVQKVIDTYSSVLEKARPDDDVMVSMDGTVILEATGAHANDVAARFRDTVKYHWWMERIEKAMKVMNETGQKKAIEQIEDRAKIPDYQIKVDEE